ncbi:MAG: beta-galactosidase [Planctomycetota bacterium]
MDRRRTGCGRKHGQASLPWLARPPFLLAAAMALAVVANCPGRLDGADQVALDGPAASKPVIDFMHQFDLSKVAHWGATATRVDGPRDPHGAPSQWLQIATGHDKPWPGVTLKAPGGSGDADGQNPKDATVWDLSAYSYIAFEVKNTGDAAVQVNCRVDNAGADGQRFCNTAWLTVAPGETKRLQVTFERASKGTLKLNLFGMRGYPPQMAAAQTGQGIDPAKINQILVFLNHPERDYRFEIGPIEAGGLVAASASPAEALTEKTFFPFIDEFGQFIHANWPGKVHSEAELKGRVAEEQKELIAHPGPAGRDKWGGWADGPKLEATGFFRTEKRDGTWWLVDPDGRLFFSLGIDCVRETDDTPIDERATWFRDFPGDDPRFKPFLGKAWYVVHGHYQGQHPKTFNFGKANLLRKYGADWPARFGAVSQARLRSWGLNTIGAWSAREIYELRKTPYTVFIGTGGKYVEGSEGYWGQFHDVFDPSFAAELKNRVDNEKGHSIDDPWCLGYFIDNEIAWGDETSLAVATLKSPATQAAKLAFEADLKTEYGAIEKLNAAWGTQYVSWDGWLADRKPPELGHAPAAYKKDLEAFYTRFAETYFKICRDTLKAAAPHQLYLGCRFAWVNDRAAQAAGKFCDVVSYNLYMHSVADFKSAAGDKPVLVGEFHFGALDRGQFHPGLVPVASQTARAAAYKSYVEGALKNPQLVGVHWFQYMDEPTIGRSLDGENYQIGFVDECDTPYVETVNAAREVGAQMYNLRAGKP